MAGLCLAVTLLSPAALAESVAAEPDNPAAGLSLQAEALRKAVGRPPSSGSVGEQRDLAVLRWNQFSRNPQGIRQAWTYLDVALLVFNPAIGTDLTSRAPRIKAGLIPFLKLVDPQNHALKAAIARPRL